MTDAPTSQPPQENTEQKRPNRLRRWIFIISLTLNVFVLALVMGSAVKHWHGHGGPRGGFGGPGGGPMAGMHRLINGRFDGHPELNALRTRHMDALSTAMQEARASREAARLLFRDPNRDPAALEAALADIRRATGAFEQSMHETILDAASSLPPEDFERLMRGRRWYRD